MKGGEFMEASGLMGVFYRFSERIMRLAYANLLWIFFTAIGLVVLGGFPSTIALFTLVRKWVMGETDLPVFKTYWKSYRDEFVKGNVYGYSLLIIGYIIYVDLKYFQSNNSIFYSLLSYFIFVLFIIYILTMLYFFPVFVHFELKKAHFLKQSLLIMVLQPVGTILMVIGALAVYYLMLYVPGLIPFFAASLMAYVLMWIAFRVFTRLEKKAQES
jgi:uncharacterized membrane protein YesL